MLSKNVNNKKCAPRLVFFSEKKKMRKIHMILDIENVVSVSAECIGRIYLPIWVLVLVSGLNQNSGFSRTLPTLSCQCSF